MSEGLILQGLYTFAKRTNEDSLRVLLIFCLTLLQVSGNVFKGNYLMDPKFAAVQGELIEGFKSKECRVHIFKYIATALK